ncbi:hypothetical protein B9Z19DRAFT_1090469 [Tuber borchii]|uniref:Uncharacterized protein n=1 Tax=Tuber borchii TaxID=42251 RepID=A0A2T6ZIR5_TUBBO|nr:hypothetical protein B9Z19DRAFT_1090469 [Tuber borchii]
MEEWGLCDECCCCCWMGWVRLMGVQYGTALVLHCTRTVWYPQERKKGEEDARLSPGLYLFESWSFCCMYVCMYVCILFRLSSSPGISVLCCKEGVGVYGRGLAFPVVCARAMDKWRVIVSMEDVEGKGTTSMRSLGHSRLLCGNRIVGNLSWAD